MLNPPGEELPRRRPIWQAMAAFFLDTELAEAELREIAETLHSSGYAEGQLEEVLRTEVAPLLFRNLYPGSIAGIWQSFDMEWFEREILAGRHREILRWRNIVDRCVCARVLHNARKQYWNRVLAYLREKNSSTTG